MEYDQDRGTIELTNVTQLDPHLSIIQDESDREGKADALHGALLGVGLLSSAGIFGVGPLSIVPTAIWTTILTGAFLGVVAYSYRRS